MHVHFTCCQKHRNHRVNHVADIAPIIPFTIATQPWTLLKELPPSRTSKTHTRRFVVQSKLRGIGLATTVSLLAERRSFPPSRIAWFIQTAPPLNTLRLRARMCLVGSPSQYACAMVCTRHRGWRIAWSAFCTMTAPTEKIRMSRSSPFRETRMTWIGPNRAVRSPSTSLRQKLHWGLYASYESSSSVAINLFYSYTTMSRLKRQGLGNHI